MNIRIVLGVTAAILLLPAGAAFGHAGFLLPNTLTVPEGGKVTIVASFSDRFPDPEIALHSESFSIISPNGQLVPFDRVEPFSTLTMLEIQLGATGVYRFSTGERLGRKGAVALVEGTFVRLGADGVDAEHLPAETEHLTSQAATLSESIVIVGQADLPPLIKTDGRLSISIAMDAEPLRTGTPISVTVTFEGQPLARAELSVIEAYDGSAGKEDGDIYRTDEVGKALITLDRTGPFTLLVRHISNAPDGAETDVRSYSTTLTLPAG